MMVVLVVPNFSSHVLEITHRKKHTILTAENKKNANELCCGWSNVEDLNAKPQNVSIYGSFHINISRCLDYKQAPTVPQQFKLILGDSRGFSGILILFWDIRPIKKTKEK